MEIYEMCNDPARYVKNFETVRDELNRLKRLRNRKVLCAVSAMFIAIILWAVGIVPLAIAIAGFLVSVLCVVYFCVSYHKHFLKRNLWWREVKTSVANGYLVLLNRLNGVGPNGVKLILTPEEKSEAQRLFDLSVHISETIRKLYLFE